MQTSPSGPLARLAILCALLSVGFWIWSNRQPKPNWETSGPIASVPLPAPAPSAVPAPAAATPTSAPETASATPVPPPTPVDAAPSPAPAPVVSAETPAPTDTAPPASTPEPPPSAEPTPAPAPLEIADLARQPQLWPKQVLLVAPVRFNVIMQGKAMGSILVPARRPVILRKINPDGTVEIQYQSNTAITKHQDTDLLPRARAAALEKPAANPPAPSSGDSGATSPAKPSPESPSE